MKVRIRRVPPSAMLEGVDLRPFTFREGRLYEVEPQVAKVLLAWGYAETRPERAAAVAEARPCAKCGSSRATVIGQSTSPPLVHLRCGECGYVSVQSLL